MSDLISRRAAMDVVDDRVRVLMQHQEFRRKHVDIDLYGIKARISNLPPAQPEPKMGKWIIPIPRGDVISYSRAYWECDQCHKATYLGNEMNFCPNCGADMRGETNDTY